MEMKPGYKQTEAGIIPEVWASEPFDRVLRRINAKECQIATSEYRRSGALPVIDQGKEAIVGFTDRIEKRFPCPKGGVIVFGDHTRVVKFADFDFAIGADGTQLLVAKDGINTRYLAYQLQSKEIPNTGYNRHFKFLKERLFVVPSTKAEQEAIAEALSDADSLIESLEQLLAKKRNVKQGIMQELLTGKSRLPGFMEKWKEAALGQIGKCFRGVSYNPGIDLSPFDTKSTVRLLRANNVQDARLVFTDMQYVDCSRVSADQYLRANDILICMANGSRDLVGKAAQFAEHDDFKYTFGAFMACFRPSEQEVDPNFALHLFHTEIYRTHIAVLLAGSSINNISPGSIEALSLLVPQSKAEQAAIASILSELDAEVATLEKKLAKARNLKQGMMQELLTGRIRLV